MLCRLSEKIISFCKFLKSKGLLQSLGFAYIRRGKRCMDTWATGRGTGQVTVIHQKTVP